MMTENVCGKQILSFLKEKMNRRHAGNGHLGSGQDFRQKTGELRSRPGSRVCESSHSECAYADEAIANLIREGLVEWGVRNIRSLV